jgi:hypothetical protein
MKFNVGNLDRSIRYALGWAIITAGFYYQSWWGTVGLILLATGLIAWCPAYSLLNIDRGAKSPESAEEAEIF